MDGNDLVDTSFLRPVDVQRFANQLNIDARAAKREKLSDAERRAADTTFVLDTSNMLNGRRQTAEQDLWKRLDTIQQLILSQAARVSFAKCKNESEADLNDMRILLRKDEGELAERSAFYQEELKSFEQYRFKRKLSGPAKVAPPPLAAFLDLIFIWVLEAAINMYFLQVGEKNAWVGAAILALLISAVNLGFCLFVGYAITKLKNSVSWFWKTIGITVSLAFFPVLVFAHYSIAQYRAQEQLAGEAKHLLNATQYMTATIDFIKSHPFQFTDIISLLLFLISLGFGLYAWHKGYAYGDKYPGYSKRYSEYRIHRLHFEALQEELLDSLADTRDRIVDRISEFIEDVGPSLLAMEQNASTAAVLVGHLQAFRESCDKAQQLILSRYFGSADSIPTELIDNAVSPTNATALERLNDALADMRKSVAAAQEAAKGATAEADRYRRLAIDEINSVIDRLDKLRVSANVTPA